MANTVTLTCPSCGGRLEITQDIDRFICAYCGNEHIVKRGEGIISVEPILSGLKEVQRGVSHVQQGVDKTASELAIRRLQEELSVLRKKRGVKHSIWKGEKARMGCMVFFVSAFPAFVYFIASSLFELPDFAAQSILEIGVFIIPAIVLGFVFYFVNQDKAEIERNQTELDEMIVEKEKQLAHHRELVAH